ncbi:MAG: nuclear pore complex subunit [Bacteroidetes bacterium]|nr:DUF1987 domain-containing protein [Bacteroidia bacterium]PCH68143.1 MAG: nuclear pore complex subunit [Bacteroidota bacterium]
MEDINIVGTVDTPEIVLNKDDHTITFSGKSLPEDAASFYQPVVDWLESYRNEPFPCVTFVFKFMYFNTSSSKLLLDIICQIDEVHGDGHDTKIQWHYKDGDEDMEEAGEEFEEVLANSSIELIAD